jgi:hypothetical protein
MEATTQAECRRAEDQQAVDRAEKESLSRLERLAALACAVREAERRAEAAHRLELQLSRCRV